MTELTLHLCGHDQATIMLDWFDSNNISRNTKLEIVTCEQPSKLEIRVIDYSDAFDEKGEVVAVVEVVRQS